MIHKAIFTFILGIILVSCQEKAKSPSIHKLEGSSVEFYDKEMHDIIDSNVVVEVLAEGFTWSEGPLWLETEQKLIFSDVPNNTLFSWDEKNGKQVYLTPSGYTIINEKGGTEGANGLALNEDGKLLLCQHGNRALAMMNAPISSPKSDFTFVATQYHGKKFSSPNDLAIAKNGDIYFTDPPYGLPKFDEDSIKEIPFNGVYQLHKNMEITLLDSTMTKPNGVAISEDQKNLYVSNSDPDKAQWIHFELDDKAKIISRSIFADVTHMVPKYKGLPDGMKISKKGYIFASGPGGILVFSPDSRHLGTIMTGQATANCAFDTQQQYLYMTADDYLVRIRLKNQK